MQTNCSDPNVVQGLVKGLKTETSFAANCNGHSWRVGRCIVDMSVSTVLCVDCENACSACATRSYIVAPCKQSALCRSRREGFSLLRFDTRKKEFDGFSSAPVVTAGKNSIMLSINATAPGIINCAAIDRTNGPIASVNDVKGTVNVVSATILSAGKIDFLLNSLVADTDYVLYCFSENVQGLQMGLHNVLSYSVPFHTLCCRSMVLDSLPSSVVVSTASSSGIGSIGHVLLDSSPSTTTIVTFALTPCPANSSVGEIPTLPQVSPPRIEFLKNTRILKASFTIKATAAGCFVIKPASSGVEYERKEYVLVVKTNLMDLDPPTVSSAALSSDGRQVFFTFDSDTNRGASTFISISISTSISTSNSTSTLTLTSTYTFRTATATLVPNQNQNQNLPKPSPQKLLHQTNSLY